MLEADKNLAFSFPQYEPVTLQQCDENTMKIVFEINHPAQAHLFKNLIRQLILNKHQVTVFVKQNTITQTILEDSGIQFTSLGKKGTSLLQKGPRQIFFVYKLFRYYLRCQFQLGVGVSVSLPLLSRFTNIKTIVLDDDDKKATPLFAFLAHNFTSTLLRPKALLHEGKKNKTIYYPGYHELAYLHPSIFKPDSNVLKEQGLSSNESFFLIRLVALEAHHDSGVKGISKDQAHAIVRLLKKYGRVIITQESEKALPTGSEPLKINPAKIHHLMAHARLVISDGQTMCSEAACLGVPSVRINDFAGRISYLEELESKWQLTYGFKPKEFNAALKRIEFVLKEDLGIFKERSKTMIENSIAVTNFLVWFIENYPYNIHMMQENTNYQYNFK